MFIRLLRAAASPRDWELAARLRPWIRSILCFIALLCSGCSLHPMPDDVTYPIKTEDIIFHARCEIRTTVLRNLVTLGFGAGGRDVIAKAKSLLSKVRALDARNAARPGSVDLDAKLTKAEKDLLRWLDVAVAYDFDFNVAEQNNADAAVGFKIPYVSPAAFNLSGNASLHMTRQGQRQFKAGEKWATLIARDECDAQPVRSRDGLYPISGRIGLDRLVDSFVDISNQGGAKDSFVETLIFTTEFGGSVSAAVKLNEVANSFRLVSAGADLAAGRKDIHKMVVSLVFPHERAPRAIVGVEFYDGYLNAPFDRPTLWRARYNICVADARSREDSFKMLRHEAPEVYCIRYADAFAPSDGPAKVVARSESPAAEKDLGVRKSDVPPTTRRFTPVKPTYYGRRPDLY